MTDYISREAFIKWVEETYCKPCEAEGRDYNHCRCGACQYDDMMRDAESFHAADVRPVEWIPVAERLPKAGERVLCYCRANIYEVMKMRTDGDWVYDTNHVYMHSFVTHWMPLPQPPKEG